MSFKEVEKEQLKAKGNQKKKKKSHFIRLKKCDLEKEIFEPTSKRSLHLTQCWLSGLSFEEPMKFLTTFRSSAAQLLSFSLMVDFLRNPLNAAGKYHWEQENWVVMSPFFCLSPLIYIKMGFFWANLAFLRSWSCELLTLNRVCENWYLHLPKERTLANPTDSVATPEPDLAKRDARVMPRKGIWDELLNSLLNDLCPVHKW